MEEISITLSSSNRIMLKSQVLNYQLHGEELEGYNLLDFVVQMYEEKWTDRVGNSNEDGHIPRGHPPHQHIVYKATHPEYHDKVHVMRAQVTNVLPNFVGQWCPRADDEDLKPLHCALMLVLLKPWCHPHDLKMSMDSWESIFNKFMSTSPPNSAYGV